MLSNSLWGEANLAIGLQNVNIQSTVLPCPGSAHGGMLVVSLTMMSVSHILSMYRQQEANPRGLPLKAKHVFRTLQYQSQLYLQAHCRTSTLHACLHVCAHTLPPLDHAPIRQSGIISWKPGCACMARRWLRRASV